MGVTPSRLNPLAAKLPLHVCEEGQSLALDGAPVPVLAPDPGNVGAGELMGALELHAGCDRWTECLALIPLHLEACRKTAELALHDETQRLILQDIAKRTERVLDQARRELAIVAAAIGDSRRGQTAIHAYLRTDAS